MRRKRLWKRISAMMICATLMLSTTVVYASDVQPTAKVEEQEQSQSNEEVKTEETSDTATSDNGDAAKESKTDDKSDGAAGNVGEAIKKEESQTGDIIAPEGDNAKGDVAVTSDIEQKASETDRYASASYKYVYYDGTGDVVLNFDKGSGASELKHIRGVYLVENGLIVMNTYLEPPATSNSSYSFDLEKGQITIKEAFFNRAGLEKGVQYSICAECIQKDGGVYTLSTSEANANWKLEYTGESDETMPQLIPATYEFNGLQDITFKFQDASNDIKEIKNIRFELIDNQQPGEHLSRFNIDNYGTSYNYDLEKGELTFYKHALSALIYGKYPAVGNTYQAKMTYLAQDGTEKTVFGEWRIKVLERDEESTPQHVVNLPEENPVITKSAMEDLINKNQTEDVVIITAEGLYYSFEKGTMRMVDGREEYAFGAEIYKDYSILTNPPCEKNEFAFRINYDYEGDLPAPANISIPVDSKWIGQTLYYYEVKDNGEYNYLTSAVVDSNSMYTVKQSHCSDYIAITRAPAEDGSVSTEPTNTTDPTNPDDTNKPDNNNNQTDKNKQESINKPVSTDKTTNTVTKNSPKTGDNNQIALYLIVSLLSACGIGVVCVRRKFHN